MTYGSLYFYHWFRVILVRVVAKKTFLLKIKIK